MQQVLEVADITINLLERSVRKNGEEIILKPMEFDLLVMLAKNKNIALFARAAAARRLGRGLCGRNAHRGCPYRAAPQEAGTCR